jgi:hypothetical protein
MTISEMEPEPNPQPERRWKRVRVKRKRPATVRDRLIAWYRPRQRRIRLWLVIGAMGVTGFIGFVAVRSYLDSAAASAAAEDSAAPR